MTMIVFVDLGKWWSNLSFIEELNTKNEMDLKNLNYLLFMSL